MTLVQFQQPRLDFFLVVDSEAFLSLMTDPEGQKKYQGFLEGAKYRLRLIEHSLGQLAGKGVIDEIDFASALSDARRGIETCCAGGWAGFTREGTGCFGTAVNLEITLRSMRDSLGRHMVRRLPETEAAVS